MLCNYNHDVKMLLGQILNEIINFYINEEGKISFDFKHEFQDRSRWWLVNLYPHITVEQ